MAEFNLGTYGAKIELDDTQFNKGMNNAEKNLTGAGKKTDSFSKKAGKVAKGAVLGLTTAVVGVGTAAFAATNKVTQGFDRIAKTAPKLGLTTDAFQEMEYWAGQNGISAQTMERAVGRLNQRMGLAAEGNEKYSSALTSLGVSMDDVKNGTVSTDEAMTTAIQTLSGMTNEQEKSALASELFGTKMARDLMPALKDGALTLEDAKKKAEELGIVIGEDSLASAELFQDTWDDLTRSFGAFGQKIIAELMPTFQTMMEWILDHMPQIQSIFQTVFNVIGTIFDGFKTAIGFVIDLLSQLFTSNQDTMNGVWQTIQERFTMVVNFLKEAWEMIKLFWNENGEQILENAKTIFTSIWETVQTYMQFVENIIQTILDLIVPFVKEKLDQIMKFWDENGEQIMQAVENAFSFIQGVIEFVMPIIQSIIGGAWEIIQTIFDTAIGVIMGLVKTFSSLLTGDFEGVKEGLTSIWESLWDGIKGIVSGAWNLLSGAFGALWDNIGDWFSGLKDDAIDWGKNMIKGFVDGIKQMGSLVASAAEGVVDKAADFIKFWSPAKKGEGRYITHWGRNMVDGWLDGVKQESSKVGKVMDNMIGAIEPQLNPSINSSVLSPGTGQSTNTTNNSTNNELTLNLNIDSMNGSRREVDDVLNTAIGKFEKMGFKLK